jgi:AcrR family transcriptional regulator
LIAQRYHDRVIIGNVDTRARIVSAAADLLAREGRDGVTTRAVAAAADVQAPAIYRLFGDKDGLLRAVAEHGYAAYLADKRVRQHSEDPVADLRAGWDVHVGFGLANPALYALMYGDPRPGVPAPADEAARRILREHLARVARAGRLRVSEARAENLVLASGRGIVLTLLAMPEDEHDLRLVDDAREATIAAITTDEPAVPAAGPRAAAVALRSSLADVGVLSAAERAMLAEWLDRLADSP